VCRVLRGDFGLNVISTRSLPKANSGSRSVITIIAFIILGGAAVFGFIPMQDGSPAPGLTTLPLKAGSRTAACRS
jgi:S-methylmethionine transporter